MKEVNHECRVIGFFFGWAVRGVHAIYEWVGIFVGRDRRLEIRLIVKRELGAPAGLSV